MTDLQKNHYKEKKPEETVVYLQHLLKKYGIEVEETWIDKSCIDTFSLRLNFKGTTKGTNGKGVTKEYAQASAYVEKSTKIMYNVPAGKKGTKYKIRKEGILWRRRRKPKRKKAKVQKC